MGEINLGDGAETAPGLVVVDELRAEGLEELLRAALLDRARLLRRAA